MKILPKPSVDDEHHPTLDVRREMSLLRALDHPNIVRLHEVMQSSQRIYLVMDLAPHGDLFTLIKRGGPLSEAQALIHARQLIHALRYCHNRGVYHRDLKPENLLLGATGQVLVSDFGLSFMQDRVGMSVSGRCGSAHYCAPEVWGGDDGYDGAKADAFSVGVVLYTMLVGKQPWNERDELKVMRAVRERKVKYPQTMTKPVREVLKGLLNKDPKQRWGLQEAWQSTWIMSGVIPKRLPTAASDKHQQQQPSQQRSSACPSN